VAINLTRKTIVAAKTESESGVANVPSLTADVQLVYGDGAGVYQADTTMIDMPSLQATLSPQKQIAGRSLANVSIQTCLQQETGAGTAETVKPFYEPLLVACGMNSAAGAGTYNHEFKPTSTIGQASNVRSATVDVYQGGAASGDAIFTRSTGVYLNADFNLTAGQAPTIQFTGQGKYVAPTPVTVGGTVTNPTDTKVLVEAEGLTMALSSAPGNTIAPICRSITFSTGNSIIERGDVNSDEGLEGLMIISRAPTLNLVVEAEDILRTNYTTSGQVSGPFFANLKANDTHSLDFTHQSGVTNISTNFNFPKAQLTSVNLSDDGGIRVFNLAYALIGGTAGDDEYKITVSNTTS
jgi:hypothetical protein